MSVKQVVRYSFEVKTTLFHFWDLQRSNHAVVDAGQDILAQCLGSTSQSQKVCLVEK